MNYLDPKHHLWCNHGWWHLNLTVYPDAWTKERIRWPLGTRSLKIALVRRDELMTAAQLCGVLNRQRSDDPRLPLEGLRVWASEKFQTRLHMRGAVVPMSESAEEEISVPA